MSKRLKKLEEILRQVKKMRMMQQSSSMNQQQYFACKTQEQKVDNLLKTYLPEKKESEDPAIKYQLKLF